MIFVVKNEGEIFFEFLFLNSSEISLQSSRNLKTKSEQNLFSFSSTNIFDNELPLFIVCIVNKLKKL